MGIIKEKDQAQVKALLAGLAGDVQLVMFTQEVECQFCQLTRELVEELAALSDRLTAEVHDFVAEAELAASLGIDKIPAIAVVGAKDYGIRFYGIPAGYEFTSLVEAILDVGRGAPELPDAVLADVAKIDAPVHLQAMITPT